MSVDTFEEACQFTERLLGPELWGDQLPQWDLERACWTVRRTEHWLVDVLPMIYNFRLVLTPVNNQQVWARGWCYYGRDAQALATALLAARAFNPEVEPEPVGYDKALM